MTSETAAAFGKRDAMFNTAGVSRSMNLLDATEDNRNSIIGTNGRGCLSGMQTTPHQLIAQRPGSKTVNTAAMVSRNACANVAPCCPSKWAVASRTQPGAYDQVTNDITVTGFAPGVVATEMPAQAHRDAMELDAAERPGHAVDAPLPENLKRRVARPADITGTTTVLAVGQSVQLTGQVVTIDGGMTLI